MSSLTARAAYQATRKLKFKYYDEYMSYYRELKPQKPSNKSNSWAEQRALATLRKIHLEEFRDFYYELKLEMLDKINDYYRL